MFHENGPVQSAAKALRLLGLLMEAHQPLTPGRAERADRLAEEHDPRPFEHDARECGRGSAERRALLPRRAAF